ncbi:amidase [Neorhizobium galegae]|uniref:amidase n=1 Tax=Neorhizobium galegae TaxID=399 RepID=UPI002102816A|nr:amidase [Neorhizobium galegae]MCQ1838814.1 amidase [Neorhizobium galegae]
MSDYDNLDALAMADLVRRREVAPDHFVREAAARVAVANPVLNAVVHEFSVPAAIETEVPFAGVPLWLKDTGVAIKGELMTSGTRLYQGVRSPSDSTLGGRLRRAGFVFMGRTNTPELALSFTAEGEFHGSARNPWDLTRSPGGSSGGAAALVGAGIVPLTQASDGAGSIRVPCAHTGTFGFKPSRLRNPHGPLQAEGMAGMSTLHGISRSVRDSAAMLDITHGGDIGDPWSCPAPSGTFISAALNPPKRLRIGMQIEGPEGYPLSPEVVEATEDAARLLTELGHHVEIATPVYDNGALARAWFVVAAVNIGRGVKGFAAARGIADPLALLEPVNAEWVRRSAGISGEDYLGAVQVLQASSRAMGTFFQTYDIYLSPVTAEIAPKLGELAGTGLGPEEFFRRFWAHAPLTAVFNASGCPAMSVPLYWTTAGLPVGAHFGAAFGGEELLFSLAGELELARPWAWRRPKLDLEAMYS